jgi:indole-3-glycerol phosphate synthase
VRRLSQAISEGDGISVLVEVRDAANARAAAEQGAEGLVLRGPVDGLADATQLPLLAYGTSLADAVGVTADAIVIPVGADDDALADLVHRAAEAGLECVLKVRDEDDLEKALEQFDPEILLLSAEQADEEQPELERLLELLPDIPVGKLAIADLGDAGRAEIEELERAGVDAVIVAAGDVDELVGDTLPEL